MTVYKRLVQVGRVAFITKGKDAGKLITIVDVIDGNHVLVDGPSTGVCRGSRNLKDLQLTKFKLNIRVSQRSGKLKKVFDTEDVAKKFSETTWAKKNAARQKRASLTDFDRFKLMRAKQLRNRLVRVELAKLKKVAKN